jgi:YgiT-type zinc finger domain-containing protein
MFERRISKDDVWWVLRKPLHVVAADDRDSDITVERDGTIVVIKEVPGLVCPNCGEEYVPDETAAHALETAEAAASSGSPVRVLRYRAA